MLQNVRVAAFTLSELLRKSQQWRDDKFITPHKPRLRLKSDSHLPKKFVLFASIKALENDEKCFLIR